MRADGQEFGEAGRLHAARSGAELTLSDLKTHLLARVNQFCNSQLHDDATLMVIAATDSNDSHASSTAECSGVLSS